MVSSFSHPIRSSIKSLSDMATLHLNYSFYRPTMMALEQCHPKNNHLRAKFNCIKVNIKVQYWLLANAIRCAITAI